MRYTFIGVLLLVLASTGFSQDAVVQILRGTPQDPALDEVLYLAAGVELTRAGLDSLRLTEDSSGDVSEIRAAVRAAGSRFVLLTTYQRGPEVIEIEYALYDARRTEPLATSQINTKFDIDLDSRASETVRELISEARIGRARSETTRIEGVTLEPTVQPATAPVQVATGPELTATTNGMFLLGDATEYFQYGLAASIAGGYAPAFETIGASIGARTSFTWLFARPGVEGGDLYLLTVGPDVFIGSRLRRPTRVGARVSGGAAVLIVSGSEQTLMKTVPFVDAGVSLRFPLGSLFTLGVEVSYLAVLEPGYPIMGFVPAFVVGVEP